METASQNAAALTAIERRAHGVRLTVTELCEKAGVAYSTVYRARSNPGAMKIATLRKLEDKLDELEAAKARVA